MDTVKFAKMLSSGVFLDKDKKRLTVSVPENATSLEVGVVQAMAEAEGWKEVVVVTTHKWANSFSFTGTYIDPADKPQRVPGQIYA